MTKYAETIFFFLATVAALALPALPALQEAGTTGENTLEAALPSVTMERVVVLAPQARSPQQVALVR